MLFLALTLLIFGSFQSNSTYTISGTLSDGEGKAAAGISVTAFPLEDSDRRGEAGTRSDSEGNFVIHPGRAGKYILIYNDEANGHVPQYIAFFRDPNNPPPEVVVSESAPSAQVSLRMSKNGRLSGQAFDAQTRLPLDHVTFRMCLTGPGPCWGIDAKSADGRFSVPTPFVAFSFTVAAEEFQDWFGLTGGDRHNAVSVPAGTNTSLTLLMKRRSGMSDRAISEAEKVAGVNLPAPEPILPADNQVIESLPRATTLEWKPVEGAVSYGVEVDYCEYRKNVQQCLNPQTLRSVIIPRTANLPGTSYEFKFIGAQPGRWRVWAVDKEGREGFKSGWRTFVYLK